MDISDLNPKDHKFIVDKPDDGFSPERNRAVIEYTIRKAEEMVIKKRKEYRDQLAERVDAVATYLTSDKMATSPITHYFSKKYLAYLRGEAFIEAARGNRISMDTQKLYSSIVNGKK